MKGFYLFVLSCFILFSCSKDADSLNGPQQSHDGRYLTDHTFTIGQPPCSPVANTIATYTCSIGSIPFSGTGYKSGMQIIARLWYTPVDGSTGAIQLSQYVAAYTDKKGNFSFTFDASAYPLAKWGIDIYQAGSNGSNPILYGEIFFTTY